jgi:acyl-coenzyme A thioesterase PaaI-like protein
MSVPEPKLFQRFLGWMTRQKLVSDRHLLQWYPPFLWMRIRVLELSDDWRHVRIRLPLNSISRNPGGVMFGGFQAALADPIAALACARVFPGHSVWTRAMQVEFELGGSTDLELRFDFDAGLERQIRAQLDADGRSTPVFEYGYYLADGRRCTVVRNTVAVRPKGYRRATSPPAPESGLG